VIVDAEFLHDDALEVGRAQRTTPSTLPLGPVSTIAANSASRSGDGRGFGPSGPAALKRWSGRRAAIDPVADPRERQKPPAPVRILRPLRQASERLGRIIFPHSHRCWHGANPPHRTTNQQNGPGGIPPCESTSGPWHKIQPILPSGVGPVGNTGLAMAATDWRRPQLIVALSRSIRPLNLVRQQLARFVPPGGYCCFLRLAREASEISVRSNDGDGDGVGLNR
jgi:hypothetical protein